MPSPRFTCFVAACAAALSCHVSFAAPPEPARADNAMVVTAQHLATRIGVDILKKGGNAVDAAVAVGYALAVTYPAAGNLGGGGFMTLMLADGRKTFIDFRETAPLAAKADMYLDKDGNVIEGASTSGHLAVAVPGTVAGLEYALAKYGTMKRSELIAPSIDLADKGFVLDEGDIGLFRLMGRSLRTDPATAKIFLNAGRSFDVGDRLVQKDLANTLREISRHGADGFYKGPVSAAIIASSRQGKGILSQADFDQYRPRELAPIECDYRGHHIVSAPPPSSGGTALCEILGVLEGYPLRDMGFHSAQAVHVQVEAMRQAYADRNAFLGDPDFVQNPIARLLDKAYATKIRNAIAPDKAGISAQIRPGVAPREGSNTTHYSIMDKAGNAVSVTYTLNEWFGARVTAEGTGVLLNDEMDDFTSKLGKPNLYGLVQGEQNRIDPGKRPLSSMTPTIVTRDGKPVMVVGTAGGSRIISTVLNVIVNVIDYGMELPEAVAAPRFHQQWLPEPTTLERGALGAAEREKLEAMGHRFTTSQLARHVAAILVNRSGPRLTGVSDPGRESGLALGY